MTTQEFAAHLLEGYTYKTEQVGTYSDQHYEDRYDVGPEQFVVTLDQHTLGVVCIQRVGEMAEYWVDQSVPAEWVTIIERA